MTSGPVTFARAVARQLRRLVLALLTATYLLVSRTIAFVGALYLALYFASGTRLVRDVIVEAIDELIPGTISCATVQWGPGPSTVRVADARIFGREGQQVLRVEAAVGEIHMLPTLLGIARMMTDDAAPLKMRIGHVDLGRARAAVRIDDDYEVDFVNAFEGDPGSDPFTFDITASSVAVLNASGVVHGPGFFLEAEGLESVTGFSLTGEDRIAVYAPHCRVARVDGYLSASTRADALTLGGPRLRVRDLRVDGFDLDGAHLLFQRARAYTGDGGAFELRGWLDAAPTPVTWGATARLRLPDGAPLTHAVTGGALRGPLQMQLTGGGDVDQVAAELTLSSPALYVFGAPLTDARAAVRFEPRGVAGDPYAHAAVLDRLDAAALGGRLSLRDGIWDPHPNGALDRRATFGVTLALDSVSSQAVAALATGLLEPARLAPLAGAVTGVVTLGGLADDATDEVIVEAHAQELDVRWEGAPRSPLAGRYTVSGAVRYRDAPPGVDPADGEGPTRSRTLELERVAVDGRGDRLRLRGAIDLARRTLELEPYLRFGEVHDSARRLGIPALHGRLVLKAGRVSGTFDDPRFRGTLSWSRARLGDLDLGHVTAGLSLAAGALSISDARTVAAVGEVELDGRVSLFDESYSRLRRDLPFQVTRLEARGLDLGELFGDVGVDAPVDIRRARLRGTFADPIATLAGQGKVTASRVTLAGEPLRRFEASFEANAQRIALDNVAITTLAGHPIRGSMTYAKQGERLHGTLVARDVPLRSLRHVRRALPDLVGAASANLTVGGTLRRPSIIGRLSVDGLGVGGVHLGGADLDLQTLPSGRVDISSANFFEGFELVDGSGIDLDGFTPTRIQLGVDARRARLSKIVPSLARGGLELVTSASAALDLHPGRRGRPLELSVTADPGELQLGLRDRGLVYQNRTALSLVQADDRVLLAPVTFVTTSADRPLTAANTEPDEELRLCGSIDAAGVLDAQVAGAIDLGVLGNLQGVFSVLQGELRVAADPGSAPAAGARCLADAGDTTLTVKGPLDALAVSGHLEPVGVTVMPRGLGRRIRLDDGGGLLLRPGDAPGVQRVISSPSTGLRGELEDGRFSIGGALTLVGYQVDAADLEVVGTDLFYASPGEFHATFDPNTRIAVRDFGSATPKLSLSGSVVVTEGRFTKSFDTFAKALGSAIGGGGDAYAQPLTEALPWLGDMTLDLDVVSRDFAVQSDFPLGKARMDARLDLSVGGTLSDPRVHRRVDILPGGSLTYRVFGRTFEISGGFADFTGDAAHPAIDVTAQTEVRYLARASSDTQDEDDKEVMITLRIHGVVPDLTIDIDSDDSTLDRDDLQSLILTGRPRRDLDRSSVGTSLVSYDLSAVFNDLLKAPFVREVALGLTREGDIRADVGTCFGPDLCFTTSAVQETAETTLRARFRLRLGDDLTCDGTLRRSDTAATSSTEETYEARCRYRIPLD